MKILIITGSPHSDGTSSYLAKQFMLGARTKGHEVHLVDAGNLHIRGCLGCNYCRNHGDICIQKDEMTDIMPYVLEADLIVFSSPVYCMGPSAQLKTILDRFYVNFHQIQKMHKKWALIMTCNDQTSTVLAPSQSFFHVLMNHLGWEKYIEIYAQGYNTKEDVLDSHYASDVYQYGYSL